MLFSPAMKTALRALPVVLAALLLAAHFSRGRSLALAAFSLALPLLLLVRARWAAVALRAGLVLGAAEWARTLAYYVDQRIGAGRPWGRLALILGAVAALTALAALAVKLPPARGTRSRPETGPEAVG